MALKKVKTRYDRLAKIAPIWFRIFKEHKLTGYFAVFLVSLIYAVLNGYLTVLIAGGASQFAVFGASLFYFTFVSLYVKVNAFGGKIGLPLSIIGAAIGMAIGSNL